MRQKKFVHEREERPSFFTDFASLESYLDSLGLFRMRPGLERVHAVLARLGLTRPPYTVAQIVGTNGKGSTSTMLSRLAREHGLKAGLHTSPHFVSVRERIRVNGAMLAEEAWVALAARVMKSGGETLSYFEFVTCLAGLAFAEAGVDLAVMEAGLGGSFDATTALEADLVVLTPFGIDHQAILGPTLKDIAADKAGAIRAGKPVISAAQREEAWLEVFRAAQERKAPLELVSGTLALEIAAGGLCPPLSDKPHGESALAGEKGEPLSMRLKGAYQRDNARLALVAWRCLLRERLLSDAARTAAAGQNFAEARASSGGQGGADSAKANRPGDVLTAVEASALAKAWLPGRMQYISPVPGCRTKREERAPGTGNGKSGALFYPCSLGWPPILLDGAHNSHGLAALGLSLAQEGIAPAAVIFACLEDKDPHLLAPHVRALATGPIFVPPLPGNPRAMEPSILASLIGLNATPVASLTQALEAAARHMAERLPETFAGERPKNPLLICGSLYLLGEFFTLRPDCLEEQS